MADEGAIQNSHVTKDIDDVAFVSSKSILIKVVEVALSIFSIGLIVDPFNSFSRIISLDAKPKLDDIAFIYITLAGYIIINTLFIIGHLAGDRMPKRTSLLFSVTGIILHTISGILLVVAWAKLNGNYGVYYNTNQYASKQYMDMVISSVVFTFVNAIVFGFDIFFTIKYF